jgi:hypothetical protein
MRLTILFNERRRQFVSALTEVAETCNHPDKIEVVVWGASLPRIGSAIFRGQLSNQLWINSDE